MEQSRMNESEREAIAKGLIKLREPFPDNQIGKLPKPTKAQTDEVKADFKKGIRCTICGGWHHPQVVHLDYVGHAAITDRLLDVDPAWSWEPLALTSDGLPATDKIGGLWIKLSILGVTRLGYGDASGKSGGDAIKELIGDALRNAAMRFGCALDLWHKGDLHLPEDEAKKEPMPEENAKEVKKQPINNSRLNSGMIKIMAGEYTTQHLENNFTLTEEQESAVIAFIAGGKWYPLPVEELK
jgi:hypothetical protein